MRLRGGGPQRVEMFARLYTGAFVVSLVAALLSSRSTEAAAVKPQQAVEIVGAAATTIVTGAQSRAVAPTLTVPPAPVAALAPDVEHRLHVTTAPDGRPAVVLTFDDGPHPFFTPRVLDILNSRGVKAVFCVVGTEVARYRSLVARIPAEGHALCNHSENHDAHMSVKDPHYVAAMLRHPSDLIRDITGQAPALYRGPGGNLSVFIIEEAHRLGMRILGWSVDPADYFKPGATLIQDRVISRLHPGAVVLLHDGGGERTQTVEQLAGLIDRIRAAGYSFVLP